MAHIFHPIIGDRPHGCNKQNRLWKEKLDMTKMLLHAQQLKLRIDDSKTLNIEAKMSPTFSRVIDLLNRERISG
jgi:tRNA pseudouridine65 synthase